MCSFPHVSQPTIIISWVAQQDAAANLSTSNFKSSSVYMGLKRKKLRPYDRGYSEHFHREFFRRIQNCIGRTGTSFDVLESMAQAGVLTPQTPPTIAEANDFASSYLADPDYFIEDDLLDQMSRGTLHQLVSSLRGCVCADQTVSGVVIDSRYSLSKKNI